MIASEECLWSQDVTMWRCDDVTMWRQDVGHEIGRGKDDIENGKHQPEAKVLEDWVLETFLETRLVGKTWSSKTNFKLFYSSSIVLQI